MSFDFVIEFLKNHYELIISICLVLISFVLALVKKKPVNSILFQLYDYAVSATQIVELTNLKGQEKLEKCIAIINVLLKKEYPNLDISQYRHTIVGIIENILKTPQKKKED